MKIIVPKEVPENMTKALIETIDFVGAQLNEIADKYGVMVSIVAYKESERGKMMYVFVSDADKLANCFVYHTGEYATDEQKASMLTLERK